MTIKSHSINLNTLPNDLLVHIISYLDLQSISRLSRTCNSIFNCIRSDSIWRLISKNLVGPWIHTQLISDQFAQFKHFGLPPDSPIPFDWTLDSNSFPLSHFNQSSSSKVQHKDISSWYQFATRFLIPHFHYLGWHISIDLTSSALILVTYDIISGRLIVEEVRCRNLHTQTSFFRDLYSSTALSMDRIQISPPVSNVQLPPDHFSAPPTPTEALPPWLPLNQIELGPDRFRYIIPTELNTPHADFTFEIFTPIYHCIAYFAISPFEPHYTFIASCHEMQLTKPLSAFYSWEDFTLGSSKSKVDYASKLIAHRSNVIFRQVLNQTPKDYDNIPTDGKKTLHSFKLIGNLANQTNFLKPPDHNPRIRYQGGTPHQKVTSCNILLGGKSYNSTLDGSLCPVTNSPECYIEYYSFNGPSTKYNKSEESPFDGLWTGTHLNYAHFGKMNIQEKKDFVVGHNHHDNIFHICYQQLVDLYNAHQPHIEWELFIEKANFQSVSLTDALQFDTNLTSDVDAGWLLGHGKGWMGRSLIEVKIQFIRNTLRGYQHGLNRMQNDQFDSIEQIRVKWPDARMITSFYKVQFY